MKKKLKTLDEHNARLNRWLNSNAPHPNGIACPKCGEELYDSDPMTMLASDPPQKNIACLRPNCGYIGFRIA